MGKEIYMIDQSLLIKALTSASIVLLLTYIAERLSPVNTKDRIYCAQESWPIPSILRKY